jgi:hypothetical protein
MKEGSIIRLTQSLLATFYDTPYRLPYLSDVRVSLAVPSCFDRVSSDYIIASDF